MTEPLLEGKHVLVVEDNTINQLVVKHSLGKLGATTEIVGDGTEAIEKLGANNYDFILMDIQLPEIDGYETTKYIRNQLKSNVPIIAMTALALKGEDEKCFECGMNGYISKPFTIDSLFTAINKVLDNPQTISSDKNVLSNHDVAVDISMLYQIAGDDDSYISTMINTFLENMPVTIDKMEVALQQKDWDGLYRSAHYAKSSLSVIKVKDMYEWVDRIEFLAKNQHDLGSVAGLLQKVKNKFAGAEKLLLQKFGSEV